MIIQSQLEDRPYLLPQVTSKKEKLIKDSIKVCLLGLLLFLAINCFQRYYEVALNVSSSLAGKVYLVKKANTRPSVGHIIGFNTKETDPFFPSKRFLKIVAGVPGDVLKVDGKRYSINNFTIEAKERSKIGKELSQFIQEGTVIPEGKYFVISLDKDSYDSRYFGYVSQEQLIGRAWRVF